MQCSKCGFYNSDNLSNCQNCGNVLNPVNNNQNMSVGVSNTQVNTNNINQSVDQSQTSYTQSTSTSMSSNYNQNTMSQQSTYYPSNQTNQQSYYSQPVYQNGMYSVPPSNKSKKLVIIIILLVIVLVGMVAFLGVTLSDEKDKDVNGTIHELKTTSGTRTIMIYLLGSNLESEGAAASSDLEEMINSKFDDKSINLLIYTGGAKRWFTDEISSSENAIFEVTSSGLKKVKSYSKKSMVKDTTLTEFIDYVYDNYESDLYDLILWDHGGGPLIGYGLDEYHENDHFAVNSIDKALNNSKLMKETKFEMIGFDACLMASVEIANVLKEEANYLVASEENEPGAGWDYSFLSKIKKSTSSEELGKQIVKYYGDYYEELNKSSSSYSIYGYNAYMNYTLSLIDLSKINSLVDEIDVAFKELTSDISISTFNSLTVNTRNTTMYGCDTDDNCYNMMDLYGFSKDISKQISNSSSIQSSIKDCVITQVSNISGSNGISIYFPLKNRELMSQFNNVYDKLNFSKNYSKFIRSYTNVGNDKTFVESSSKDVAPIVDNNTLSVTLKDDLVANYYDSDYSIFVETKKGLYVPVYRGYDIKLDGNVLSTTPQKKELVITDGKGNNASFVTSFEYKKDDNSVTYMVLAELDNGDYLGDYKIEVVYFYVKFENGSDEGQIIDIKPLDLEGSLSSKTTYNLNDWENVLSISYSYVLDDKDGNAAQEWELVEDLNGSLFNIKKDGFKFMLKDFDKSKKYYYVFRVLDTQGIKHVFKKIQAK